MPDESATDLDLKDIRKKLTALREQLQRDIETKEEQVAEDGDELVPDRGGVSNHMADDATDTADQEIMLGLQAGAQVQLDQVNEALARLDAGTYGTCANCGKKIDPARLEVHPSSIYCMDCQRLADAGRL